MKRYVPRLLHLGLVLLIAGLFATVYTLNIKQFRASMQAAESALEDNLSQQVQGVQAAMDGQEAAIITRQPTERIPESRVFIQANNTFHPVCIAYAQATVPHQQANAAFQKAIELLPSREAESRFETAAHGPADTPEAVYQKISALFNLIEFRQAPESICAILELLDKGILAESQSAFFVSMLSEKVPDLPLFKKHLVDLRQDAALLNRLGITEPSPFRKVVDGRILSVREDRHAVLYTLDPTTVYFAELASEPHGRYREIIPGLYAVVSEEAAEMQREPIQNQYHASNVMLSLMVLLATCLIGGILAIFQRQQKLNAMRTDFIATVSHELRTPLSLIRLHAETLKHGRVPEGKVADYHQTILTEAERLTGIVNNVLDFSRMERDKLQIHPEPTDLSALVHRIADSFGDRLEQEGFAFERNIADDVAANVDPLAYSQIVFNLLDNAIKYSDGSKTVRIELDADADCATLRVVDLGIGIPDPLKKHIFDEFVRSDDRRVTARRGSGIGLNVAKRLAERMNGTIEVTDNQPQGSVFTVNVPPASSGLQGRQDGGDTIR